MATSLAYARGTLLLSTYAAVVAVDARTGHVLWRLPVRFTTDVLVSDNTVYTGGSCFNGCVTRALALRSGRQLWQNPTGGLVQVVVGGRLYEDLQWQGLCQNRVFSAATGKLLQVLPDCGTWTGDGQHTVGVAFARDEKGPWVAKEIRSDGPAVWSLPIGRPEATGLALAYNTLYVQARAPISGLLALEVNGGHQRWRRRIGSALSVIAANHLLFLPHRTSGWIDVLRAQAGRPVTRFRVPGRHGRFPVTSAFVAGGTFYTVGDTGVTAMRP